MQDDKRPFAKAFPPETTEVVRIIHGVSGSSLRRYDTREAVDVTWCRETSSRIEIAINGLFIDDHGTFGDSNRLGQSIDYAIGDWRALVARLDVGPDDTKVEVSVHSWIEDTPTFGFAEEAYSSRYYHVLTDRMGPFFLGVPPEGLDAMEFEDRKTLRTRYHSRTKIASSLWNPAAVDEAVAAFRKRVEETERTETATFDHIP